MYSPAEVARRYVETGKSKAALPVGRMLLLGILAGAFIALAGGSATFAVSYGGRLAGAAVFPAGLAMVLLAGSELFTGNCLLVIPLLERQLTWGRAVQLSGVHRRVDEPCGPVGAGEAGGYVSAHLHLCAVRI